MPRLDEILNPDELAQEIATGYVTARAHAGKAIYNYTPKAQYERRWNDVTRTTRGLIVENGEVIARPFRKFFNYGELDGIDLDSPATVYDKLDGSLGIAYPDGDGWAIATRGSLTSEQATWATSFLRREHPNAKFLPGVTYLFEIIYPANRIVVDYGDREDLVLLGGVEISSGAYIPAHDLPWDGPLVERFEARTFRDALALPDRPGREGLVIHTSDGELVKVKQDEYVRLHKIVTGWNEKTVWEWLATGRSADEIRADVPDEFHKWVTSVANALTTAHSALVDRAHGEYQALLKSLPEGWTRRELAKEVVKSELRSALFMLHDGRDITDWAWAQIKPKGDKVD